MPDADLLSAVLDSVPFPITSVDPEGRILFVNEAAARNLSGAREDLVGTSLYDYFPDRASATRERIRQTVSRGCTQRFEAVVTLPDGRERYFDSAYCPALDGEGKVIAIQIVAHDTTDERRAERARAVTENLWGVVSDDLSMTEERVKAILENAPMVVTIHDPDTTIRYINRVLDGIDTRSVIGTSPLERIPASNRPALERAFAQVVETRGVTQCEVEGMSGRRWLLRLAPLVHDDEVRQILACTLDVTEQRRLQAQLARRQKMESLGTMAGGIAHDFNNLLTAIVCCAGLARKELERGQDPTGALEEIDAAASRAADLCAQMLVYAGGQDPSPDPGDVDAVVRQMSRLLRAAVGAKVRITEELSGGLPLTRCNDVQLGQVVLNLVHNAADAIGDDQGQIHIRTEAVTLESSEGEYLPEPPRPGSYVRLTVTDSGQGMDAESQRLIFDPFFTTKTAGHGLGLSVVLGILSAQRAAICVRSEPEQGTTMTVLFPVHEGPSSRPPPDIDEATWTRGEGTVLVVDDERAIRRMAARVLADAGYEVVEAADGDAALAALARQDPPIHAVLLDVTMPGKDGIRTLRELRRTHPDLPVILSTGKPMAVDGLDDNVRLLPKPYAPPTVLRALADSMAR